MKDQIDKKWTGYKFDELKYRIVVNRVSFKIATQRIADLGRKEVIYSLNNVGGKSLTVNFEKVMSALSYFEAMVRIVKRLREILTELKCR
ncbi:MAG: hypothetical protein IKL35_01590 [Muribaculaceae bacterium]|nr:hypothetical protein [Muribaculaceae bacterium]MBR6639035.1 hypothetical protein [Muribaculaceae bacterium]